MKFPIKSTIKGFTLTELLIAASLTSVIVGAAGFGLLTIIQANLKASVESTIRYNSNRTLEFITEEIKSSQGVYSNAEEKIETITELDLPTNASPVIVFELKNTNNPVVYYVQSNEEQGVWGGEQILKRWGPPLLPNGDYDQSMAKADWPHQTITDYLDFTQSDCPSDWKSTSDSQGFWACTQKESGSIASLVDLNLRASAQLPTQSPQKYGVSTMAFARNSSTTSVSNSSISDSDYECLLSCKVNKEVTATFNFVGSQLRCDGVGSVIPVQIKVYQISQGSPSLLATLTSAQPTYSGRIPANAEIHYQAIARSSTTQGQDCNHSRTVSTLSPNNYLVPLQDGDIVPSIKPFKNQESITDIVKPYLNNDKVSLDPNEIIHLFELGTTRTTSPAYDMQDAVVSLTFSD